MKTWLRSLPNGTKAVLGSTISILVTWIQGNTLRQKLALVAQAHLVTLRLLHLSTAHLSTNSPFLFFAAHPPLVDYIIISALLGLFMLSTVVLMPHFLPPISPFSKRFRRLSTALILQSSHIELLLSMNGKLCLHLRDRYVSHLTFHVCQFLRFIASKINKEKPPGTLPKSQQTLRSHHLYHLTTVKGRFPCVRFPFIFLFEVL